MRRRFVRERGRTEDPRWWAPCKHWQIELGESSTSIDLRWPEIDVVSLRHVIMIYERLVSRLNPVAQIPKLNRFACGKLSSRSFADAYSTDIRRYSLNFSKFLI